MKKILFLLMLAAISFAAFSQTVSVTINDVVPGTDGKVKGDYVTFTVDASNAIVNGIGFPVIIDGSYNNGGGIWNPFVFSHNVTTYTKFIALQPSSMKKERVYTVEVIYTPDNYISGDPCFVESEPFTVSK